VTVPPSPACTDRRRPGDPRSVLQHDIAVFGWSVVWAFASYVTDRLLEEAGKRGVEHSPRKDTRDPS